MQILNICTKSLNWKMYRPLLDLKTTQIAIKQIKDHFEQSLSKNLKLTKVTAPIILLNDSGFNDDLFGIERPIIFDLKCKQNAVIVHSLAKWKRQALAAYNFHIGEGLYTDMNAIRRDEILSSIHSYYVDQWDWEIMIDEKERNMDTLFSTVKKTYVALKETEDFICSKYPVLKRKLPDEIHMVSSQDLENEYPQLNCRQREAEVTKKFGAVLITQIGKKLKSGEIHDMRAPDYDDWELNGDVFVYYEALDIIMELSSVGVRVNPKSLIGQMKAAKKMSDLKKTYHQMLLRGELPFTIGGGIGQSRVYMFLLDKIHIGEVQSSIWTNEIMEDCRRKNITLL